MEDLLREHGLLLDGRRLLVLHRRRAGLGDDARALAVAEFRGGARERRAARRRRVAQGLHPLDDLAEFGRGRSRSLREADVPALLTDERARFGSGSSSSTLWLPSDRCFAAALPNWKGHDDSVSAKKPRTRGRSPPSRRGATHDVVVSPGPNQK